MHAKIIHIHTCYRRGSILYTRKEVVCIRASFLPNRYSAADVNTVIRHVANRPPDPNKYIQNGPRNINYVS